MPSEAMDKNFSPEVEVVWSDLNDREKSLIKKGCPYKKERNEIICELKRKGVRGPVIGEIAGLSPLQIGRIWKKGRKLSGSPLYRLARAIEHLTEEIRNLGE